MLDKYGVGQDPLCYPGTTVLRNRLDLTDDQALHDAERTLSEIAAATIDFDLPPYNFPYCSGSIAPFSLTFTIGPESFVPSIYPRAVRTSATSPESMLRQRSFSGDWQLPTGMRECHGSNWFAPLLNAMAI